MLITTHSKNSHKYDYTLGYFQKYYRSMKGLSRKHIGMNEF